MSSLSMSASPSPALAVAAQRPLLIGNEIFRRSTYGGRHPLAIPRVSIALDLCRAMGWVAPQAYRDCAKAAPEALTRFHRPGYVRALQQAERDGDLPDPLKERYRIGRDGNPIFREVFSRPATGSGAAMLGAESILAGGQAFSPAGGTHHGRPDRASGFCYLNDPVLAILRLLDRGVAPVFYLDIDAHHGDGVQDAFAGEPRVWTLSLHEAGRWPHRLDGQSGGAADRGGGQARNLPLPRGSDDTALDYLLEAAILPLIERLQPAAIVLQSGVDGLAEDPMSKLAYSNRGIWQVTEAVKGMAPRFLLLGGGGYNPWAVARAWAGLWATLNDWPIPEVLPDAARDLLSSLAWNHSWGRNPPAAWSETLADPPRRGPLPEGLREMARALLLP